MAADSARVARPACPTDDNFRTDIAFPFFTPVGLASGDEIPVLKTDLPGLAWHGSTSVEIKATA